MRRYLPGRWWWAMLAITMTLTASPLALAQSSSPSTRPATGTQLCVTVYGPMPSDGWTPASLEQSIADGETHVVLTGDPSDCAPVPSPVASTEPTATPDPTPAPTLDPYDDAVIIQTIDDGVQRTLDWSSSMKGVTTDVEVITLMTDMGTFAKDQLALTYQPSPCLSGAWTSYRHGMQKLLSTIVGFLKWYAKTGGYTKPPSRMGDAFTTAGQLLGRAQQQADTLSCSTNEGA
jgi:hypothetical protein